MLKPAVPWLIGLVLVGLSCGPGIKLDQDIADYRSAVRALERRIERQPDDAEALRELGVIYVSTRHYTRGHALLEEARAAGAEDPKTRLYLGLAFEFLSDSVATDEAAGYVRRALHQYEDYAAAPPPYRKLMQGRYRMLSRELARREVQGLLAAEQQQGAAFLARTDTLSPNTIGVFTLRYQGQDERFAPLGRGLSELMAIDLAGISRLTVVERVRLQALLDEQALAASAAFDQASAPRRGLLIGAGTVVGGTYNVLGSDVQLDVATFDVAGDQAPPLISVSEALSSLFQVQKDLVLRIVADIGITLTPEEQARIQVIPTRNLEAFLAYSLGLQQEDEGQFAEAEQSFRRAVRLDPTFTLAEEKAAEAESLADVGASPFSAWVLAQQYETYGTPPELDVVDIRLQNLGTSIQTTIVPGEDHREGPEESVLPPPPPVPPLDNR